jgi:hypothetical protein
MRQPGVAKPRPGVSDEMATKNVRKSLYPTGPELVGTAQPMTVAKFLARQLISEFGRIDLSVAVVGTALAIVVSTIAAKIAPAHRDDFYEKFITAARESEGEWGGLDRPRQVH